jgi:hypothetical protein
MKIDMDNEPLITRSGEGAGHDTCRDAASGSDDRGATEIDGEVGVFPAPSEDPEALITIVAGQLSFDLGLEDAMRRRWAWTPVECGEWLHLKLLLRGSCP